MRKKGETIVLGVLLAVLAGTVVYFYRSRDSSADAPPPPVSVDAKFTPLNVDNPALRLDILKRFLALQYKGVHRSIFSATSASAPGAAGFQAAAGSRGSGGTAAADRGRQILWLRQRF